MQTFSKSKTAKAVSAFVGIMTGVMMIAPVSASAATAEELTAQINGLLATIASLQGQLSTLSGNQASASASCFQFTSDLEMGMDKSDVKMLQVELNKSADTKVSDSGNGAPGSETTYFGGKTKSAVQKFQTKSGITPVSGYVGPKTRAKLNSGCVPTTGGTGTTVPTTGAVSASLASDSPTASTLISPVSTGATLGTVAKFTLSNGTGSSVKVTGIKMKRTGVSSDTTINNVYLYNGSQRVTDSASVSQGNMNFNDTAGIVMIPGNSTVTLTVKVEVAAGQNGQTLGVMLTEVTTDASGTVGGLPVSASQHNIATAPSGMTTVDIPSATALPATASVDPQSDFVMWQRTINVGSREADLKVMRFRQIGSVLPGDLANFRLQIDGQSVGSAVATLDSTGYVTFDLASAPKRLMTGNRTVKLLGDIVSGSNRNFLFSLRQAGDFEIADSQLGVTILPTVASASFSNQDSGTQSINQGVLTITKETDSPSGNTTFQASGITLGKFKFKAQGEKLKIENLRISFAHSNGGATAATQVTELRNGAVFANGVQIGSTADILEDSNGVGYTQINLGSSLVVTPGQDVVIEIRGDVYDGDTTNNMAANDTFTASVVAGSSNIQRLTSLNYFSNSAVSGNQLTVASGSASLSKYTAYANQTVTVPQTAFKLGEFRLQSGTTEQVNLNTLTLAFTGSTANIASHVTDVYITYGSKTTPVKGTVALTGNTWSINELLPVNTTLEVKVYGTLSQAIASASTTISLLTVDGTGVNSGNSVTTGNITGQTVTVGTGSLTVAADASTPVTALAVGGSQPKVASFKLTGTNDTFTLTELYASTTANGSAAIGSLIWKDGATTIATTPFSGAHATTTGLSLAIPANTSKVVDAYLQLGSVGTPGAAATGLNVQIGLVGIKYRNSNGVETVATSTANIGNPMYVFKTKPTISPVALPSTTLTAGTQTVAKFTVSADAAGTIAWRKLALSVASSSSSFFSASSYNIYDSANESTPLANVTVAASSSGATVVFTSSVDQEVSGSKTYVVKATVSGVGVTTGASLSHSIAVGQATFTAPAAYASVPGGSTFIWSDESEVPHSATTATWSGDFLIKNIPTDSQTLTK